LPGYDWPRSTKDRCNGWPGQRHHQQHDGVGNDNNAAKRKRSVFAHCIHFAELLNPTEWSTKKRPPEQPRGLVKKGMA
jgi:hypothetical protein